MSQVLLMYAVGMDESYRLGILTKDSHLFKHPSITDVYGSILKIRSVFHILFWAKVCDHIL